MSFGAMHWLTWTIPAVVVGFFLITFLAMTMTAVFEKRPIRELISFPAGDPLQLSAYATAMNESAKRMGFSSEGTFRHAKGGMYKTTDSIWVSPDRKIIAVVVGGSLARVAVRNTKLITRIGPNLYLNTADEFAGGDLAGVLQIQTVLNADFEELCKVHSARVAEAGERVVPFATHNLLEELQQIERSRVERLRELRWCVRLFQDGFGGLKERHALGTLPNCVKVSKRSWTRHACHMLCGFIELVMGEPSGVIICMAGFIGARSPKGIGRS